MADTPNDGDTIMYLNREDLKATVIQWIEGGKIDCIDCQFVNGTSRLICQIHSGNTIYLSAGQIADNGALDRPALLKSSGQPVEITHISSLVHIRFRGSCFVETIKNGRRTLREVPCQ